MNTLLTLVDSTLEMLEEAMRPLFADTPIGKRRAAVLQRKLAAYFRKLDKSFPLARAAAVYNKHEKKLQEAIPPPIQEGFDDAMLIFNEWVGGQQQTAQAVLESSIAESIEDGFTGDLGEWINKYGLTPPPGGLDALVPKGVLKSAQAHVGKLVKGLDEETARELAQVVANALRDQRGIPGLTRDIHSSFDDMSRTRAETIARTETNRAFSEGSNAAAEAVGSKQKEWIQRSGYEDECAENAAQGRIPFNDTFSSGDDFTPAHPDCTCDVAYYGATKSSVEGVIA